MVVEENTLYVFADDAAANAAGFTESGTYYTSIGNAVKAAKDGETVLIAAGEYNEVITGPGAKNNITITGETDSKGKSLVNWTGGITLKNADKWDNIEISNINFVNDNPEGKGTILSIQSGSGWEIKNCSFDATKHDGGYGWNPIAFPSGSDGFRGGYTISKCHFKGGSIATRLANDPTLGYAMKVVGCYIENTNFNMQSSGAYDVIFENNDILINYDLGRDGNDNAFLVIKSDADQVNVKVSGGTLTMYGDTVPKNDYGWSAFSLGAYNKTEQNRVGSLVVEGVTIQNKTNNSFISNFSKAEDYTFSINLSGNTFKDADGNVVTDSKKIADEYLNLKNGDVAVDYSNFKDADGNACDVKASMSHKNDQTEIAYTKDGFTYTYTNDVLSSVVAKDEVLYLKGEEITADLEYKAIKTASGTSKITDAEVKAIGLLVGDYIHGGVTDEKIGSSASLEISGSNVYITGDEATDSGLIIGKDSGVANKFKLILKDGTAITGPGSTNITTPGCVQGANIRNDGYLEISEGSSLKAQYMPIVGGAKITGEGSVLDVQSSTVFGKNAVVTVENGGTLQLIGIESNNVHPYLTIGLEEDKGALKVNAGGNVIIQGADNAGALTINKNGVVEVAGGSLIVDNGAVVNNNGTFKVTGTAASTVDAKIAGNALLLANGVLKDSEIDGNIMVTGNSAFQGTNTFADKAIVKVSGGTLTIEDGASMTGPQNAYGYPKDLGISLIAGSTNESWMESPGLVNNSGAGKIVVDGDVFAGQVHAAVNGNITVSSTGKIAASSMSAGVAKMTSGKAGIIDIYGEALAQKIFANAGGSINVYGKLSTSLQNNEQRKITVSEGSELYVDGGVVEIDTANKSVGGEASLTVAGTMTLNDAQVTVEHITKDAAWNKDTSVNYIKVTGTGAVDATDSSITANNFVVEENGKVSLLGGNLDVDTLTNNGTFKVTGSAASTVKANITGNALLLANGVLEDSKITGLVKVDGTNNTIKDSTVCNVYVNWADKDGTGFAKTNIALSLDNATTGNVFVGSDVKGYSGTLTVGSNNNISIYNRVYGTTKITGSDNVIAYLNAKGSVSIANAKNTEIEAMIAKGGVIDITDSDIDFAIGTGNVIELNEKTAMTVTNSDLSIQKITVDATSELKLFGSTVKMFGTYDYSKDLIANNGTITMDAASMITSDAITGTGTITVDAKGFSGIKKVIDITGAGQDWADGQLVFKNLGKTQVAYGADGDVVLANVDTKTLYVNSSWATADKDPNTDGVQKYEVGDEVAEGKYFGFNAFASATDALNAASENGGANIQLDVSGTDTVSPALSAGNYVISGGNGKNSILSYFLSLNAGVNVKFDDAYLRIGQIYSAAKGASLVFNNSVIGTSYYGSHNAGWCDAWQGSITINNSLFGVNIGNASSSFYNYTEEEIKALPRSASETAEAVANGTYSYLPASVAVAGAASNNSGPHFGTHGEATVTDSTMCTAWISIIDRGLMTLDNSVLYYGGAISIGKGRVDGTGYNMNESGWDWTGKSADGFRTGEVATMDVKDSTVINILGGNGNEGARIQVGSGNADGSYAGALNITNSYFRITPYDAEGKVIDANTSQYGDGADVLSVKHNGSVTVIKSTLITAKIENEGTITVDAKSLINAGSITGSGTITVNGGTVDVDTLTNSGDVTVNGATFNAGSVTNNGEFTVKGTSTINATVTGNAIQVAKGAKLSGTIKADLDLKGDISINGSYTGKITGNKNISVKNGGSFNGGEINSITVAENAIMSAFTFQNNVKVKNVTLRGTVLMFSMNAGSDIDNIVIDGKVTLSGAMSTENVAVITGKNNAELTLRSASFFNGNKVSKVKLNLNNLSITDGYSVNVDVDTVANIKSVNGASVVGNAVAGYTVKVGDVIYSLVDNNSEGLSFEKLTDTNGVSTISNYTGTLDIFTGEYTIEAKEGTANLTVSKNKEIRIAGITKNENGGVTNVNVKDKASLIVGTTNAHGSVAAVGKLTTGSGATVKLGDVTGTNLNTTINLGKNNEAYFDNIDLKGGSNTLSIGANSDVKVYDFDNSVAGSVKNVKTIKLASGTAANDKKGILEDLTTLNVEGNIVAPAMKNSITLGNYAQLFVDGNLVNSDVNVGTTIKAGNYSEVIFGKPDGNGNITGGEVTGLAGLTIGTGSTFKAAVVGGTSGNNTISFGNNAKAKVKGDIDLLIGKDTIKTGSGANVEVSGDVKGVENISLGKAADLTADSISGVNAEIKLAAGIAANDKKGTPADFTALKLSGDATGINKLTVGKAAWVDIDGILEGTAKNDTITFANDAAYSEIGSIDLGDGNDKLAIGNNVTLAATAATDANIIFGNGNDTLTIGKNATLAAENIIFGEAADGKDKDTLTLGADSALVTKGISGAETINAAKGSLMVVGNGAADVNFDGVKGSWKNAAIYDLGGVIEADGSFTGETYANEWDVFAFSADNDGKLNIMTSADSGRVYNYALYDVAGNEIDLTATLQKDADYFLAVNVETAGFDKAEDKGKFSGVITIA